MRRFVGPVLGLIAAAAGIAVLWAWMQDVSGEVRLVLAEVDGEVHLIGADGQARATEVGAELDAADRIATRADARAVLEFGRDTRIRVGPESSLRVTSVGAEGVRLYFDDGALEATVRPESPALRIASGEREVVATNAEFSMGVRDGVIQVATTEGEVSLSGVDQTRLPAGSQATIVDRRATITAAPEDLLLNVEWPAMERTRAQSTTLVGKYAPAARVVISGPWGERVVHADETGRFEVELPLSEGSNQARVLATDLLGHTAETEGTLETRDTLGPSFSGGVRYGN